MSARSEPCPHCDGTGRRAVPPAPGPRGGTQLGHTLGGKQHGYEATYTTGCRCDLCRAAHRVGAARRKAKPAILWKDASAALDAYRSAAGPL